MGRERRSRFGKEVSLAWNRVVKKVKAIGSKGQSVSRAEDKTSPQTRR